jgi:primosomal protein N' (replication factor Y) (superfamily II helicase)
VATAGKRTAAKPAKTPAADRPIARVAVDIPLAHLDRPFDYRVEASQSDQAQPGCRVRVRFAGQLVDGIVLDRVEQTEHAGRLSYLDRAVSAESVLTAEVAALARAVADRWAGTFADVMRLAVPPRHARVEGEPAGATAQPAVKAGDRRCVDGLDGGVEVYDALAAGDNPRAVIAMTPGDWPTRLAALAAATVSSGRGVVLVVPDHRDVARLDVALGAQLGAGQHVTLSADLGPAERYRRFLRLSRGSVRCAVGTRSAVWAPVRDLGCLIVWDDGDDTLAEPRAPYAHARDVAVLRAHLTGAVLLIAGHAVSAEGAALTESGWARAIDPTPTARTTSVPAMRTAEGLDADDPLARAARLPTSAWQAARAALNGGRPVLVQVPRRGYVPALSCDRCRLPARCAHCAGPLARPASDRPPTCRWCGVMATTWQCANCGGQQMRAAVIGARRTAEELGRAFPGVPVRTSGGDAVLASVPAKPAVVVATPGAEPVADGGYGAALLLDGWALLSMPDLRAGEESLRRWLNAAALVCGESTGGTVIVVAPGELRPVQALLRWQPRWHAERETAERSALHLPPAARMAAVSGAPAGVHDLLAAASLPVGAELLGPMPDLRGPRDGAPTERMLVRVPRRLGGELATALKQAAAQRSARKAPDPVRIELDPQRIA